MRANLEVNPADIRFTQDSISLYFQFPYDDFSVREAVRKLSRNNMRPEDFPPIRVNLYGGCLWSIDNRRLWVFRLARCSSINVKLVKKMHPRVKDVLSDGELQSRMQVEDFFPRLRDRGKKDLKFDQRFPQPIYSLQLPVAEALEKPPINVAQVSNVDIETSETVTIPGKSSINPVEEEHKNGQIEINIVEDRGTTGPTKPSIHPMEDRERMITDAVGSSSSSIFARARKIANVGRMIRNAVGGVFFKTISFQRRATAAVAKTITDSVDSIFSNVIAVARTIVSAVHKYFW